MPLNRKGSRRAAAAGLYAVIGVGPHIEGFTFNGELAAALPATAAVTAALWWRRSGQKRWLLLKDQLTDKFYSFDASLLPDGGYTVKVVASDAPSHSPDQALSSEKESARFEVDTTPPQIEGLSATVESGKIHVTFRATDSFSTLKRAEYSIDADDWQFVEPVGQLSDSKSVSYDFRVPLPQSSGPDSSEHVIVVRVYDKYDNEASAKFVIHGN